jgi:hypothetical protein
VGRISLRSLFALGTYLFGMTPLFCRESQIINKIFHVYGYDGEGRCLLDGAME